MYSENQIKKIIEESPSTVVEALKGQALSVAKINADNAEIFENISDSKGHLRFIEGDITCETIEGLTQTYGKWSLSGTHLMIVIAGNIANGTVLTSGDELARITNIPKWILDKIYPVFASNLEIASINAYATGWGTQSLSFILSKPSADALLIRTANNVTLTDDRGFRIAFDLLIDNASE